MLAKCRFFGGAMGALQVSGNITLGASGGDAIAEDLPTLLKIAAGSLDCTAGLDAPDNRKEFRGCNVANGSCADVGKDVFAQPADDRLSRVVRPGMAELREPLLGDELEGIY
jgi:hypothetical protein